MNGKEGCRRVVVVISWLVMFYVWIAGFVFITIFAIDRDKNLFAGWALTFVAGIIIKVICKEIGLWVVDGFFDDQKNKE